MPAPETPATTALWRSAILAQIAEHPDRPLKLRALARQVGIPNSDYTTFREFVRQLLAEGTLVPGPGRTLRLPGAGGQLVGTFHATRQGFGFVACAGRPDLYIREEHVGGALEGDTVSVRLHKASGRAGRPRGEIVRIVERAPLRWVGQLERTSHGGLVRPQGRSPLPPVRVDDPTVGGARPGELVVVEPRVDTLHTRSVRGVILARLGDPADARAQIRGAIYRHALPEEFPPTVRQAAEETAARFQPRAVDGREDLRASLTVTIDPPDARDFDDAVSIEALADGTVRLGVHIADVAHFVPEGGTVDLEARRRGTSVYFPGYAVMMLPEALSAGVCSLRPGEPRYAKSVFITYDREARIVETRWLDSLICSAARLTYEQVNAVLQGAGDAVPRAVRALLKRAESLAQRIQRRRLRAGMIALRVPEVAVRLDERGHVVDAGPAETSFAHTIVEMFMVEANEVVSRALTSAGLPHLRRIHPAPAPEAAESLAVLAPLLGDRVPRVLDRAGTAKLLDAVRGRPEESLVHYVLLRALSQASYSPNEEGHFALASDDYCHFTSPIRRYPDLTVHRLLEDIIRAGDKRRAGRHRRSADDLAGLGREASAAERRAQQAQREAVERLLLELMKSKLGAVLDGVVTGVMSFGVFVQVRPYLAEGVVRVADFGADEWRYDRAKGVFIGRRSGRVIHIGETLRVQVAAVDEVRQELLLQPVGDLGRRVAAPPVRPGRAKVVRRQRRQRRRGGR